jgi:phage terminase large subunit-like protein
MSDGEDCSFSVAQVWASNGIDFFLVEQFRRRCRFDELTMNVRTFAKRYRGAPILIEETATGPTLFSALTLKQQRRAVGIRPVDSKVVRFARHIDKIVGGKIEFQNLAHSTVGLWTSSFDFRMAVTTTKSTP